MASDRRFGLPHPFDSDPFGDSSPDRKPGLWETLKRALGAAPTAEPATAPPVVRDAPEARAAAPPRPAAPAAAFRPSAPPQVPPPPVDPSPAPAVEATLREVAAVVPFLEDLPVASPPPDEAQAPPASPPDPSPPPEIVSAVVPQGGTPAPPRLARGLASFSRDNAKRERKFAHLLRNSPSGAGKSRPESRKRR